MAAIEAKGPGRFLKIFQRQDPATLEILDFQSPSGALIATEPGVAAKRTIWMIVTMALACLAAAGLIPIDKVVTGPGQVVSLTPTTVIQPLQTAIVRTVDVHEHQKVHKGQLLATLDPTFSAADLGQYEAQVRSYGAQVARDRAELDGVPYKPIPGDHDSEVQAQLYEQRQADLHAHLAEYDEKIASLTQAVHRAESDARGYAARLGVANDVESMRRSLENMAVGSKLLTLSAIDTRLEMARFLATALSQVDGARNDLNAMKQEREGYLQDWRAQITTDMVTAMRNLSDAQEAMRKARLVNQLMVLRAPEDGEVLSVAKVGVGSVMQSGDQLMTIMPANAKLEVAANILGSDIGFVKPGQNATIKLNTFQYTEYGTGEGTVRSISPDAFTTPQGVGPNNQAGGIAATGTTAGAPVTSVSTTSNGIANSLSAGLNSASYYETRVSVDRLNLHGVPPNFRLIPGLPVVVDVKVGTNTILQYLMNRVLPIFDQAMREP